MGIRKQPQDEGVSQSEHRHTALYKEDGENWGQARNREIRTAEEAVSRWESNGAWPDTKTQELIAHHKPRLWKRMQDVQRGNDNEDMAVGQGPARKPELKEGQEHHLAAMVGDWAPQPGLAMLAEALKPPRPNYRLSPIPGDENVWPGENGSPDQVAVLVREPGDQSPQAVRVLAEVELAMGLFVTKNRGYGETGYVLGARGQYADLNRKMGKLKHTLWDGNAAVGEDVREMVQDLIGHCGLLLDFLRDEEGR